jgi:hypothetical protein
VIKDDWHHAVDRVRFRVEETEQNCKAHQTTPDNDDEVLVHYADLKAVIHLAYAAIRIRTFVLAARVLIKNVSPVEVKEYFKALVMIQSSKKR